MSDIHFVRQHPLSLAQAKKVAQKTADDLAQEYDLDSEWQGDTLHFHRSGVSGQMKVSDDTIDLTVKLSLLFKPFKAKFESHIEHRIEELILAAAPDTGKTSASNKAGAKSSGKTAKAGKSSRRA